jgi:hypothetical protein
MRFAAEVPLDGINAHECDYPFLLPVLSHGRKVKNNRQGGSVRDRRGKKRR